MPDGGSTQTTGTWPFPAQQQHDPLFVIDNSASMAAKQALLLQNLSKMMLVLEKLENGVPDIHIGVVSTDVGAGLGAAGGDCSSPLGDQGLLWGNDPTPGALATVAGTPSNGCGLMEGVRWIEDRMCPDGSRRHRNYRGELADVLSCMGTALGNHGCGYSHALQALRVALNPIRGINEANQGFLRPRALLHIIIISDKDDCSADQLNENNDGVFSAKNPGDDPILRCAARGHVCDGREIPNYDPSTGYDGTQGPWSFDFGSCAAKQPNPSNDPHWLPLISLQDAIDSVRQVKLTDELIHVAGVIGWPEAFGGRPIEYRIDRAAGSGSWDLSPICGAPATEGDGSVYPAYRLRRFIDAFSRWDDLGFATSMCGESWTDVMLSFGGVLMDQRYPACMTQPLVDGDPNTPDTQPDCQVSMMIPGDDSGDCGGEPEHEVAVPECTDGVTGAPVNPQDPRAQLAAIPESLRPCWYLIHDSNPLVGCPDAFENQRLALLFKAGQSPPQGGTWSLTCRTEISP
jgi:hypothetical protein